MSRDWSKYNGELVKRGEILIDSMSFGLKAKSERNRNTGRPPVYSDHLILMLLFIKFALKLPYGQTQGLAKKLFQNSGLKIPDFRTLHYRFKTMEINIKDFPDPEDLPDDFVIVLDSTGIKVTNRGEWLRKKHGKRARKGWIKLHVAFDLKRKKVVEIEVTDERVHDSQKAKKLVEGAKREAKDKGKKVSKVVADSGYDTHEFFRYLHDEGICAGVLVRKGAKVRGNPLRDEVVRAIRRGKRRWKERIEYGKRWLVENFFSVFKRWFGEYVVSLKFENMKKELVFKVGIMNMLMMAGVV
ncbi:IS5-like element ISHysp1 family transposase [Hydrogenivirga sp. 128-5-R1-1]|uniref:IS5-like element ISHysp1 family transposase n=1 Tax=Hydrogenivirga sp. 128-5-R1-1 TaxID=392423 RepID=UPI00015EF8A4|nr:IS5-like element ISHysp1 family transposase [Hydrogenivirga sp. 128-5-R1-1]EDP75758.1 transposase [Hydrogenivirga sp. 128-5-R1-1]